MYRIGIVGSDSSHADDFARLLNIPDSETGKLRYPDLTVTAIYGRDEERTKQVAEEGIIPNIVNSLEDMIGLVDAVMIVFRSGNLHLECAIPFLKTGIPIWIDKPFTITNEDCIQLIELSKNYNTPITGGSTCKYMEDIITAKCFVNQPSRLGETVAASLNYPADTEDDYGGIYFYAHHLCEMCLQIFGYHPVSVVAVENNRNVSAIVKYENYNITLNFLYNAPEHMVMIHGTNSTIIKELDSPKLPYYNALDVFVSMLKTGEMPLAYHEIYTPVAMMNAIVESYKTKKEVAIELLDF